MSNRALLEEQLATLLQAALSPEDLLQFLYYIHSIIGNASKIVEEKNPELSDADKRMILGENNGETGDFVDTRA